MIDTKQKQIGARGHVYHVQQFGARQGGRILVRLMKTVAGAAGAAMGDAEEFDLATIGRTVGNLAESASEEDFDFLCESFVKVTKVEGGPYPGPLPLFGVFDDHFAGEYQELGEWLLFGIEANYGGFLGEGGLIQRAKQKAVELQASTAESKASVLPSTSPDISGKSGGSGE